MTRCRVSYDGRVQGVGFRATACRIADDFEVGGTVRNLDDGRVELVVEGPEDEVETFLAAVRSELRRVIREEHSENLPPGEPFPGFRVAY
ncbi:acylphosphatase [Tautonia plasticadhaerens]|uniref:acylphosphatase n=1 Tax=Tautonia plasticadhaerens TaxID=2527974 RepID=A0A518H6L2_9BACT|nr:acylphosphatase [Tautonia plasticadhaerens]QDV36490.1 Acylphosphatase [Tautonia plasticadhaerens]